MSEPVTGIAVYIGTQVGDRWWKRYRAPGFFAGGRGRYWFEEGELRFHRDLSKELTRIPLEHVGTVSVGTWHVGTWHAGKPIVKVAWERDGERLSSGFSFGDRAAADTFKAELRRRLGDTSDEPA